MGLKYFCKSYLLMLEGAKDLSHSAVRSLTKYTIQIISQESLDLEINRSKLDSDQPTNLELQFNCSLIPQPRNPLILYFSEYPFDSFVLLQDSSSLHLSFNIIAPEHQDPFFQMPSQFISFSQIAFHKSGVSRTTHIIKGMGGGKSLSKQFPSQRFNISRAEQPIPIQRHYALKLSCSALSTIVYNLNH